MKILILTLLFIAFVSVIPAFSQPNVSVTRAIEEARQRNMDMKNRSIELDRMRRQASASKTSSGENNLKFPEIKEDFERIQIVNANSLQALSIKENPNYKTIFKAASEIKKRAFRLKSNLFPIAKENSDRESAKKDQDKFLSYNFKKLAIEVDNALFSFVSNNIFQNTKLVDLKDSQKAESDLEKIIALCSAIETKVKLIEKPS